MGNIKIKADISLQDCRTKEIFDLIKDGFYELLKRLNSEDISNKKKDTIVKFITEDFKKEQNEHIDILLNIGFINEEDINKNLNIALENGLITTEYYDHNCIKRYEYIKKENSLSHN